MGAVATGGLGSPHCSVAQSSLPGQAATCDVGDEGILDWGGPHRGGPHLLLGNLMHLKAQPLGIGLKGALEPASQPQGPLRHWSGLRNRVCRTVGGLIPQLESEELREGQVHTAWGLAGWRDGRVEGEGHEFGIKNSPVFSQK